MTMTSTTTAAPAPLSRDDAGTLLGQTMGVVALTAGLFALGGYIGRDTSGGWGIACFFVALALLLAMNAAAPAFRAARGRPSLRLWAPAWTRSRTDPQLLRQRRSAGLAGGQSDCAVRCRIRRRRLRDAARPLGTRALSVVGARRADRLRDRARVRADPWRGAHLRNRRPRGLCGADAGRLSAAAPHRGPPHRAASRRVDLPRDPQRVSPVPVDLRPRSRLARRGHNQWLPRVRPIPVTATVNAWSTHEVAADSRSTNHRRS
jgi:hypothetical protein